MALVFCLSLSLVALHVLSIPGSEMEALSAIHKSTKGSSWIDKWDFVDLNFQPCKFVGISCANGSVVGINLSGNNLNGTIPDVFQNIESIERIDLSNNSLVGTIPHGFFSPRKLTYLNLRNNNLNGPIPRYFTDTSDLQHGSLLLAGNDHLWCPVRNYTVRANITDYDYYVNAKEDGHCGESDYTLRVLESEPEAYWPLDETSTDKDIRSVVGEDKLMFGSQKPVFNQTNKEGGRCMGFRRAKSHFLQSIKFNQLLNTKNFSVSLWMRCYTNPGDFALDGVALSSEMVGDDGRSSKGYAIWIDKHGFFQFTVGTNSVERVSVQTEVQCVRNWTYVAMTYQAATPEHSSAMSAYINGTLVGSLHAVEFVENNSGRMRIGAGLADKLQPESPMNPGFYFDGDLSQISFFKRALSAHEIHYHFSGEIVMKHHSTEVPVIVIAVAAVFIIGLGVHARKRAPCTRGGRSRRTARDPNLADTNRIVLPRPTTGIHIDHTQPHFTSALLSSDLAQTPLFPTLSPVTKPPTYTPKTLAERLQKLEVHHPPTGGVTSRSNKSSTSRTTQKTPTKKMQIKKKAGRPKVSHTCEHCDRMFSKKQNLTVHRRTHTGFKPFYCVICNRKFSRKGNLQRHERTHNGEKPHKCEYCQQRFGDQSNLNKHRKKQHNAISTQHQLQKQLSHTKSPKTSTTSPKQSTTSDQSSHAAVTPNHARSLLPPLEEQNTDGSGMHGRSTPPTSNKSTAITPRTATRRGSVLNSINVHASRDTTPPTTSPTPIELFTRPPPFSNFVHSGLSAPLPTHGQVPRVGSTLDHDLLFRYYAQSPHVQGPNVQQSCVETPHEESSHMEPPHQRDSHNSRHNRFSLQSNVSESSQVPPLEHIPKQPSHRPQPNDRNKRSAFTDRPEIHPPRDSPTHSDSDETDTEDEDQRARNFPKPSRNFLLDPANSGNLPAGSTPRGVQDDVPKTKVRIRTARNKWWKNTRSKTSKCTKSNEHESSMSFDGQSSNDWKMDQSITGHSDQQMGNSLHGISLSANHHMPDINSDIFISMPNDTRTDSTFRDPDDDFGAMFADIPETRQFTSSILHNCSNSGMFSSTHSSFPQETSNSRRDQHPSVLNDRHAQHDLTTPFTLVSTSNFIAPPTFTVSPSSFGVPLLSPYNRLGNGISSVPSLVPSQMSPLLGPHLLTTNPVMLDTFPQPQFSNIPFSEGFYFPPS